MDLPSDKSTTENHDKIDTFESEWHCGEVPAIAAYLAALDDENVRHVGDLIELDLEFRWKRYESSDQLEAVDVHGFPMFPRLDDYAALISPALKQQILSPQFVAEEYRVRSRWGDRPTKQHFLNRFPHQQKEIADALRKIDSEFADEGVVLADASSQIPNDVQTMIVRPHAGSQEPGPRHDLEEGTQIGNYRLEKKLGSGAFGQVWKAYDRDLDRYVAVKIPNESSVKDQKVVKNFAREARAAAQLNHPNILTVHEVVQDGDHMLIACEFVDGHSLSDHSRLESLTFRDIAKLCATIARALHYAHEHGVIHRDLKPANILIDADGQPKIADFGLAKYGTLEATMSADGAVLGTPAYIPPEQARGDAHSSDARSDVYSLGVILFKLMVSELPFRGSPEMVIHQAIHHPAPSPRSLNSQVPLDLETICLKCLEKNPGQRYQSALELATDLELWLAGHPIVARPLGTFGRGLRLLSRHPAVSSLVVTIFILTVGGLAAVTGFWLHADYQRRLAETHLQRRTVNFENAINATEKMLSRVIENARPGNEQLVDSLLTDAIEMYRGFIQADESSPIVLRENARTYVRIGNIYELLSEPEKAAQSYEKAISSFQKLIDHEEEIDHLDELSESYRSLAGSILAIPEKDEQLWIKCEDAIEQAVEIDESLISKSPANRESLARTRELYSSYFVDREDREQAETQLRQALQLRRENCEENPKSEMARISLSWSQHNLADFLIAAGELDEAESLHVENLRIRQQQIGEINDIYRYHPSPVISIPKPNLTFSLRYDLATTYRSLGRIREARGEIADAAEYYQSACDLFTQVVEDYPYGESYRNGLIGIHMRLGQSYSQLDRPRRALDHFQSSITQRELLHDAASNAVHVRQLALTNATAAHLSETLGDVQESIDHDLAALEHFERLRRISDDYHETLLNSIQISLRLARKLEENDRLSEAKQQFQVAVRYLADLESQAAQSDAMRASFERAEQLIARARNGSQKYAQPADE